MTPHYYSADVFGRSRLYRDMRLKRVYMDGRRRSHAHVLALSSQGKRLECVSSDAKTIRLRIAE